MAEVKNGLRLKLYNFNKRRNSTKQPNEKWIYQHDDGDLYLSAMVVFKAPTDLLQPTILLAVDREDKDTETGSGEFDSYYLQYCNYAALNNRYYWIDKIVSVRKDHWEISLISDPLATFKNWIGDTRVFAEYTGNKNIELVDTRLPRETNGGSTSTQFGTMFPDGGSYIIGVISESGFDYYDVQSYGNLQQILASVNDWIDLAFTSAMEEAPTPSGGDSYSSGGKSDDMAPLTANLANVGKQIKSSVTDTIAAFKWLASLVHDMIKAGFSKNQIASNLTCAMYYPFEIGSSLQSIAREITIGNFKTGVTGYLINGLNHFSKRSFSVPGSMGNPDPIWLRRGQFMSWSLYVPYLGVVQLPSDLVVPGATIIEIDSVINIGSGACNIRVALKSSADALSDITIVSGNCQVAGFLNVGVSQQNTAGAVASGIGAIAGVATAVAGAGLHTGRGVAMAISGASAAAANSVHFAENMTPIGSVINGASGGVKLDSSIQSGIITLAKYYFGVSCNPSSIKDTIGNPCFSNKTVKNCEGYVKASGASFSAKMASAEEIDTINAYLNSGLYYE